ncbi:hypothetical protein GCM10027443_13370 [Pontibacter brevis]
MQAQDVITKKTGESLKAKVLEITLDEVKYKHFERLEGPTYTLAKAEILLIQYEDNTKETFDTESSVQQEQTAIVAAPARLATSANLYAQGQQDAGVYYDGYKGARTGTLVTSLLSPLVGLIPAIACSSTPPKDKNLDFPSHELMSNPDYRNGYVQRSRKIKSGKVWSYWGVGLGVNLALVLMMAQ